MKKVTSHDEIMEQIKACEVEQLIGTLVTDTANVAVGISIQFNEDYHIQSDEDMEDVPKEAVDEVSDKIASESFNSLVDRVDELSEQQLREVATLMIYNVARMSYEAGQ